MNNPSSQFVKHEKALKKMIAKESKKDAKSYKEKGLLEDSAKEVVNLILQHPTVSDNTYLDVGCGTGKVCFELVKNGAAKAIGTDLSEDAIEEAKQLARDLKLEEKTEFYAQNFFDFTLDTDINGLISHMVLCCHPDLNRMLTKIVEIKSENVFIMIPPGGFLAKTFFKPIGWLVKIVTGGANFKFHGHKEIKDFLKNNNYLLVKRFRNGFKSTFHYTRAGL
jgi:SAM-dependent methyltransferase